MTRPRWLKPVVSIVVVALVVTVAVVAQGFDVKQTPTTDPSIWAIQSGGGQRYARINTTLSELDTVKSVENPSDLVQAPGHALLYAQDNTKYVPINQAMPENVTADTENLLSSPEGTTTVASAGQFVTYLTSSGGIFVQDLSQSTETALKIDPLATVNTGSEDQQGYSANAVTVNPDGIAFMYSLTDNKVREYDILARSFRGDGSTLDQKPTGELLTMTTVGNRWVIFDADSKRLFTQGTNAVINIEALDAATAVLQRPSLSADVFYMADFNGLWRAKFGETQITEVTRSQGALGVPTAPSYLGADIYGAWLSPGKGTMWSSASGTVIDLNFAGKVLQDEAAPVFQTNGDVMVLNDTASGWVWKVPSGELIASSQDWNVAEDTPETTSEQAEVTEVTDPRAPIAEPDSFGVRAGQLVTLPVLLNDHDANDDVLTILPSGLSPPDSGFGTVSIINDSQQLAIRVAPGASGSSSFSYVITDGTSADGLNSAPTQVTLNVVPAGENSAPVWCGVERCLQQWPQPQMSPGTTVSIPVLPGWVDPQGDVIFIKEVKNLSAIGVASFTAEGNVVYQHLDPSITDPVDVQLEVVVSDVYGATERQTLSIRVTPTPVLTLESFALSISTNEALAVDMTGHYWGAAGLPRVVSATLPDSVSGATVSLTGRLGFSFSASTPGNYIVTVAVADAATEKRTQVRITVSEPVSGAITTAPVSVFITPGLDSTVDVFTAVSNTTGRVLLLSNATVRAESGATLSSDVVGQRFLRVSGNSATGAPGLVGVVDYVVSDGTGEPQFTASGQAFVYLAATQDVGKPIAVDDSATARAGAQIDLPVLDNDVAPAGSTLVLDPSSINPDCAGELTFAAGSMLRILAPTKPGDYSCSYTVYVAGFPYQSSVATAHIQVVAQGENRPPVPPTLTGRALAGKTVSIPFDSFGVDPDGDDVALFSVDSPKVSEGSAWIAPEGDAIVFQSLENQRGTVSFAYTVKDSQGQVAAGKVNVGVLDEFADPSPITFTDFVQVQVGEGNQVIIDPILNDVDQSGGSLSLVPGSVVPDAKQDTEAYNRLAALITSNDGGKVLISAGTVIGTNSFRYTVESSNGSQAIGLIAVRVVEDAVTDFPVVTDTNVTLPERSKLPDGLDVVTGKVSWTSGNVKDLSLSLWGNSPGMSVNGWKIQGAAPDEGLLVPFALTGKNFAGEEVRTYGFMRIPSKQAAVLSIDPQAKLVQVNENGTISFSMTDLVPVPDGESLEVVASSVRASGQRPAATCAETGGTTIEYSAGTGAPWTDRCSVSVRLAGTNDVTALSVPITIVPKESEPELASAGLELMPGKANEKSYDLTKMVTWEDHSAAEIAGLSFVVDTTAAGAKYAVTQQGNTLTIRAADDLGLNSSDTSAILPVSISGRPGVVPASLKLSYLPAAPVRPTIAGVVINCTIDQISSGSCSADIQDVDNAYDSPLTLVSGESSITCALAEVTISGRTIKVGPSLLSNAEAKAGGSCSGNVVVKDVRDNRGSNSVDIKIDGYPPAVSGARQSGFANGEVQFTWNAIQEGQSFPAVTEYAVVASEGSASGPTCAGSTCSVMVTGLAPTGSTTIQIYAVNAQGRSLASTQVSGSAAPAASVAFKSVGEPKYVAGTTTASQTVVAIVIESSNAIAITVSGGVGDIRRELALATTQETSLDLVVTTGTNIGLTVVAEAPASPTCFPECTNLNPSNQASATHTINVVPGGPTLRSIQITTSAYSSTTWNLEISLEGQYDSNNSTEPNQFSFTITRGSSPTPSCDALPTGSMGTAPASISGRATAGEGNLGNGQYTVWACYSNGYGVQMISQSGYLISPPTTYSVTDTYSVDVLQSSADGIPTELNVHNEYQVDTLVDFNLVWVENAAWENPIAKYCAVADPLSCSAEGTLAPTASNSSLRPNFNLRCDPVTGEPVVSQIGTQTDYFDVPPSGSYDSGTQTMTNIRIKWEGGRAAEVVIPGPLKCQ